MPYQQSLRARRASDAPCRFEPLESRYVLAADFLAFDISDASGDDSPLTVLESSALSVSYQFNPDGAVLHGVELFARDGEAREFKIGHFDYSQTTDSLISLEGFSDLTGTHEFFAVASTSGGVQVESPIFSINVLEPSSVTGGLRGETFNHATQAHSATLYYGSGGTDTVSLSVTSFSVASFNGESLDSFTANSMVTSQAIYADTAFDHLRLTNGDEIYLHGIERLEFSNGRSYELQTRPNDPFFRDQWNLTIADVPDAWRFTRGSDDVLLVSIDTGIPISGGVPTTSDLSGDRLAFAGNASGSNHGHQAVSIMAATPNNGTGIAGINWGSPVLVLDVYGGDAGNIGINTAINTAVSHRDSISASRIVFQGGIQGEFWLNVLSNGLIPSLAEEALFAMAAGNGGQDISIASHPDGLSAGIARLEGTHPNVMAIGALLQSGFSTDVHGLENSNGVRLAGYSNFGDNLTFAAPTSTPAVTSEGGVGGFGGTSGANPVMAGYASLLWSIDPSMTAGEVRGLLAETAIDVGTDGRDPTFGHGVPDVGSAVRKAWARVEAPRLIDLEPNPYASATAPLLAGDYNRDGLVDAADYTVFLDSLGSQVAALYAGADGNANQRVDPMDLQVWADNYGRSLDLTTLIDATTGNGSFEDWGDSTTRKLVNSGMETIPGWTVTTTGNGGWIRSPDSANTVGAASHGGAYGIAAGGATSTFASETIGNHTTAEGDLFILSLDVGTKDGAAADYEVFLDFGGQERLVGSFSEGSQVTEFGSAPYELTYNATAADAGHSPAVKIVVASGTSFSQAFVDNVRVRVDEASASSAFASATAVSGVIEAAAKDQLPIAPPPSPFSSASSVTAPGSSAALPIDWSQNSADETALLLLASDVAVEWEPSQTFSNEPNESSGEPDSVAIEEAFGAIGL